MASQQHSIVTALPALHTSRIAARASRAERRTIFRQLSGRHGEEQLLAAFARFIHQLLGGAQEHVCFLVREDASLRIARSAIDDAGRSSIVVDNDSGGDLSDFLLDLRHQVSIDEDEEHTLKVAEVDEKQCLWSPNTDDSSAEHAKTDHDDDIIHAKLIVRAIAPERGLQVVLDADADWIPEEALPHLANLLCHQIVHDSENALPLSVLNHPPQYRCVAFAQEPDPQHHPSLLHGAFERRAAEHPDRVALDYLTSDRARIQYSYHEVDAAANRIATKLIGNGQDVKKPVAVVMGPSPEMYISYLAALKAGLPFCPVPIDAPVDRQMTILEDLECCAILTRAKDAGIPLFADNRVAQLLPPNVPILNLSHLLLPSQDDMTTDQHVQADGDDLAYIMYTSGTTGRPKGVQISHLSAACSIAAHSATAPLNCNGTPTRWFQFAAPTFDPSIMEIFVTLSGGGTLCSAERELTLDNINSVLSSMKVDVMMATPSMASLLDPQNLSSLWTMGEALNTKVISSFSARNVTYSDSWTPTDGPRGLYNAYGPTEAAINCTLLNHVPADHRGSILGPSLPSCSIIIADEREHLQPVPFGCAGELLIGGPQVSSRGYLHRPEETAKAFVDSTPWGRVYRTGDRARIVWDSHSGEPSIEFLGRISSDQVKLSGRRVELGEIDAVVLCLDSVREALTVVYKPHGNESSGSEKAVTAVTLADDKLSWDDVQRQIEEVVERELPSHMRPYRLFLLPHLPRSAAGKLDRKALSATLYEQIEEERRKATSAAHGKKSEHHGVDLPPDLAAIEERLLDVLGEILEARPSPTADLVAAAGLDSLRAMQFLSRVRAQKLLEGLSLNDLLGGASVRQLLLRQASGHANGDDRIESLLEDFSARHLQSVSQLAGLDTEDVERVLPTTATQSGMVASFMRSSSGTQKTYINHSCHQLSSNGVDLDRLITTVETCILAREAYRTTFVPVDDDLAPFAQCIISPAAAQRNGWGSVACRSGSVPVEHWLREAEREISLEHNVLYRFQVVNDQHLLISLFHGIFDGASLELLLADIDRQYRGLPLEPRGEISLATREHFSSRSKESDEFWLRETAGYQADSIPALSGDRPNSSMTIAANDTSMVQHTTSLTYAKLQARSRKIKASPLSIWQTAWALLLSSFSESQTGDVMFGSVVGNRFRADTATCHGPTFSMLPCRVRLPQHSGTAATVAQVATQIAQISSRMLAHPHPSLGLITTDEGKLPFDSLLALQHFDIEDQSQDKDTSLWQHISWPAMRNDFAVMLEIWPCNPELPRELWRPDCPMTAKMTFKTTVITATVAERILRQLSSIVDSILAGPTQTPSECLGSLPLPLLSAENIKPQKLGNGPMLLHSGFERIVEHSPDRVALVFKRSLAEPALEITYGELDRQADLFARRIHRHFDGRAPIDQIIPICLDKSPELYVAVLGILKAGAAWCPIDTAFPAQRRLELVQRTGSSLLVSSASNRGLLEGGVPSGVTPMLVDVVTPETAPLDRLATVPVLPEHLAYLIWTSGTTGAPKGVMIEHDAAAQAMVALQEAIPTSTDTTTGKSCPPRVLNFCSYSFDVFVQDLFYTWGLGGTIVSASRELILGSFVELVIATKATHAHLTPSFGASVRRKDLRDTLQVITMIGEKLPERVAEDWSWNTKAYNTYGPAENTVVSTLRRFGSAREDDAKAANVGWSLPSVSSFVVDPDPPHHLIPFNGVGELALGGYQIARGYLNDSVKTAKSFVWSDDLQQRIYLTGDTVRFVEHGIEFLGRNDDLIKLNGIRVELSEISATCAKAHEDIEHVETLLLARADRPAKAVISFASLRDDQEDAPLVATDRHAAGVRQKILTVAHQMLPNYMVPSFLVLLNHMPRTASNKVDRKVLQSVYEELDLDQIDTTLHLDSSDSAYIKTKERPRTLLENEVLHTLAKLANIDVATTTDSTSLVRLGVNSITSIRLAWQLKKDLKIDITVVELFSCTNVVQLLDLVSAASIQRSREHDLQNRSRWLDDLEKQLLDEYVEPLQDQLGQTSHTIKAIRPATTMQESLLVETLKNDRSYWSHRMFKLPADVDLGLLRAAWHKVAEENEILRTSFFVPAEFDPGASTWLKELDISSAILQAVVDDSTARWSNREWHPSQQSLSEVAEHAAQQARQEASPIASTNLVSPWSITILTDSVTNTLFMMLHIHHSLNDAQSMQGVFDDVLEHYCQRSPAISRLQFGEAMRLGLYPTQEQRQQSQSYVREIYGGLVDELGPVTTTKLPDLTGSRQTQKHRILRTTCTLQPSQETGLWDSLKCAVSRFGLGSPMPLLTAAFGSIIAEYVESKYIVLGETLDQRIHDARLETIVGPMIATVPHAVRIDLSLADLLASKSSPAARSSYHVHPASLRSTLGVPSDQPLYPAMIVFNPGTMDEQPDKTKRAQFWDEMDDVVGLHVEHPLALNIFAGAPEDGFHIELSGSNQVFSMPQLQLLLEQFMAQLGMMLARPDVPLEQLDNHLPRSLLSISNATGHAMRDLENVLREDVWSGISDPTINPVAWVEFHVRHHPHWIAAEEIVDLDEPELTRRWTYQDLLTAVSEVLRTLQERNVPKGSVVAVHLGRTLESFAAILALFRGGYIYLPLDEELPSERIQMLAADSGAKAFITTHDLLDELESEGRAPSASDLELILLEDVLSEIKGPSSSVALPPYSSIKETTDNGYILFTSGSTGKPKGVRVTNYNLCNFIECFARRILDNLPRTAELAGTGKYLNLASRAFDPHLTHMFMAWRLGLAATIGPRMMMLGNLESVINQNAITHFGTVPSVLQQAQLSPDKVPSVAMVTVGGEKVSNDVLATWTTGGGAVDCRPLMLNVYGPTECTIGCTSTVVDGTSNARNIGRVFDSATAVVFAQEESSNGGQQVIAKRGQTGELCIAGDLVSLGYLSRPEAQAKAFATTELALLDNDSQQTTRFYKTGDLVRMMADGSIEYLGRSDQQVKINGQRLELGEVEQFLRQTATSMTVKLDFAADVIQHPALPKPRLFAFVAPAGDDDSGRQPVVATTGDQSVTHQLSDACSNSLPAYMVPDLIWVSRIPHLKASDKVDKKQLKMLLETLSFSNGDGTHDAGDSHSSQPLTEDEATVVEAIESVTGRQIATPDASRSIYEFGIDSLSAVQLAAHLKRLGFKVTPANVLNQATIRNLAKLGSGEPSDDFVALALERGKQRVEAFQSKHQQAIVDRMKQFGLSVDDVLPTMPLQSALLARSMAQIEDDGDDTAEGVLYVTQLRYTLPVETVTPQFVAAVEQVLKEEPMLRTCFHQTETGDIAQVILSESHAKDSIVEVPICWDSWKASGSMHVTAHDLIKNIGQIPPLRVHIFQDSPSQVLLSMHHALFDGDAIKILRFRIQEVYSGNGSTSDHTNALKQLVVQFNSVDLARAQTFWQANLANAAPCLVDTPELARQTETKSTSRASRRLSLPLSQLQSAAQASNTSLNALFQTAFTLLLSELLRGRPEVTYGSTISLRPQLTSAVSGVEELIAPCLNTLPQRVSLALPAHNGGTLRNLAQRIRINYSETLRHALVPLDRVMKWSGSDQALFDAIISVNIHNQQDASRTGSAPPGSMTLVDTTTVVNVPLAADVNIHYFDPQDGYVEVTLSLNDGGSKASQLAERFEKFCRIFVEQPDTPIERLLALQPSDEMTLVPQPTADEEQDSTPWSVDEALVRDIICDLLQIPANKLGKRTSFYRLGMDSILVLRVVKTIRAKAEVKLSPLAILRARCVAAVEELIVAARSSAPRQTVQQYDNGYGAIVQRLSAGFTRDANVECCYLATPMQQGMLGAGLASTTQDGQLPPYVYRHTFQLCERSSFDLGTLDRAWLDTVRRVEVLRTGFYFTGDLDHPWLGVVRRDAHNSHTPQIFRSILDAATAPINLDLTEGLVRCALVIPVQTTEPITIVFTMHHAIYDASSLQLLWRTFINGYQAAVGESAEVKMQSTQFSHVAKQIAIQQPRAVEYWAKQLRGYSYEPLPSSNAGSDQDGSDTRAARFRSQAVLPASDYILVKQKCRDLGVSIQSALVLAWSKVLASRVLQQSDVVFGQVLDGRSNDFAEGQITAESVIGPTLNTVAMRVSLSPDNSNAQALYTIQRLSEEAQQHQVASLRLVQNEWRSITTSTSATSLFESLFVWNGEEHNVQSDSGFWNRSSLAKASDQDAFAEYPLVCTLSASSDGLKIHFHASSDYFTASSVNQLAASVSAELVHQMSSLEESSVPAMLPVQRKDLQEQTAPADTENSDEEDQMLCRIVLDAIAELLPGVGATIIPNTNLFTVGLDSILAIRLSSRLRRTKAALSVNQIMQGRNIAAMVAKKRKASHRKAQQVQQSKAISAPVVALLSEQETRPATDTLSWAPNTVESVLPCLAGQEHHIEYWIHAGRRFFEAPWIYKLRSNMSTSDVRTAWDKLRQHHAILRSTFVTVPSREHYKRPRVVQVTQKPHCVDGLTDGTFTSTYDDSSKTLDAAVVQHLSETNNKSSDMSWPPARLTLLQTTNAGSAIVMRLHHAMYDAWSVKLLQQNLDSLLAQTELISTPSSLTDTFQSILNQHDPEAANAFWSRTLKNAQRTTLRPSETTENAALGPLGPQHLVRLPGVLPVAAVRNLESLCQLKAAASLSPAILLSFAQALATTAEVPYVTPTFGFYHASRSIGDLDLTQSAIPTLTLLPLCIDVDAKSGSTTIEKLQSIQQLLSQLPQFSQTSMHDILNSIDAPVGQPLFNAYINLLYRNTSSDSASEPGALERFKPSSNDYFTDTVASEKTLSCLKGLDTSHIAPLRIFVDVVIDKDGDGISLGIRCDRDLYDEEAIRRFAQRFVDELRALEELLQG